MADKLNALAGFARDILGGKKVGLREVLDLASNLTDESAFDIARDLLDRARKGEVADPENVRAEKTKVELAQRHALYTYKAAETPREGAASPQLLKDALTLARRILEEGENLSESTNQETLGLAGAIAKRLWQVTNARSHLEESLGYYLRGHLLGPENDAGYNGINAAYVQDVLARLEDDDARKRGEPSQSPVKRRDHAKAIRSELVELLPQLASQKRELEGQWWHYATMAEAHLGLGNCKAAAEWLDKATALPAVPRWMLESTARQLSSLARVHETLRGFVDVPPPTVGSVDELIGEVNGYCRSAILPPFVLAAAPAGAVATRPWWRGAVLLVLLGVLLALPWACLPPIHEIWPDPFTRTADLAVELSASQCAEQGDVITYTLRTINHGPRRAREIRDTVWGTAPSLYLRSRGLSREAVDSLVFRVYVHGGMADSVVMTAVVAGSRGDPNRENDTTTVVTRLAEPGMCPFVSKSLREIPAASLWTGPMRPILHPAPSAGLPDSVIAGSTLSYTLRVTNPDVVPVDGLVLVDSLPAGLEFVSASHDGSHESGLVIWRLGSLSAGVGASRTLRVRVREWHETNWAQDACRVSLNNVAAVDDRTTQSAIVVANPSPDCRSSGRPPADSADLSVELIGVPDTVSEGSTVPVVAAVTNNGPSASNTSRVIAEGPDGQPWTPVTLSLPSEQQGRVTRSVTFASPPNRSVTISVEVAGTLPDSNPRNNFASSTVWIRRREPPPPPGVVTPRSFSVKDSVRFEVTADSANKWGSRVLVVNRARDSVLFDTTLSRSVPFDTIVRTSISVKHPPTADHQDSLVREGARRLIQGFTITRGVLSKTILIHHSLRDEEFKFCPVEFDDETCPIVPNDTGIAVPPSQPYDSLWVRVQLVGDRVDSVNSVTVLNATGEILRNPLANAVAEYVRRSSFRWSETPQLGEAASLESLFFIRPRP